VERCLRDEAPWIVAQIESDGRHRTLLDLWGASINGEGQPPQPIVPPAVVAAIGRIARVELDPEHPHAGLLHTYGYLFSTMRTPFGFKRARWVRPGIARGFGLPRHAISPRPESGTLLANVTALAAAFAFGRGEAAARQLSPLAADAFSRFEPGRVETVGGAPPPHEWILQTDLVWYPRSRGGKNEHALLVYTVWEDGVGRLVTAFPVGAWMAKKLRKRTGRSASLPTRYNAWVPGLTGHDAAGTSTWTESFPNEP